MRGATQDAILDLKTQNFNPRFPCGERLAALVNGAPDQLFQSTLPMRGATEFISRKNSYETISIHASHAGSDGEKTDLSTD